MHPLSPCRTTCASHSSWGVWGVPAVREQGKDHLLPVKNFVRCVLNCIWISPTCKQFWVLQKKELNCSMEIKSHIGWDHNYQTKKWIWDSGNSVRNSLILQYCHHAHVAHLKRQDTLECETKVIWSGRAWKTNLLKTRGLVRMWGARPLPQIPSASKPPKAITFDPTIGFAIII